MSSGITSSAHARRCTTPTVLALSGIALSGGLAAEEISAPTPTPAPTPMPAAETLTVAGEQERSPKVDTISATRLDLDLQHTPQSVTVINQDLLKTTGAFTLRDALRTVPGVTLAAGEGGRTGDSLVIRGFQAHRDTYVDNLKDSGQYFRDTFNVEQVEVLKGPSGLYFGRGTTGGAVNMVTKRPTDTWQSDVSATGGSYEFLRAQVGTGGPITDGVGLRVDAFGSSSESFRDEIESQSWGIAPTVQFALGAHTDLILNYVHTYSDGHMDYGIPVQNGRPAPVPIENYYGFTDDSFQTYDVDLYTATLEHRFSEQLTARNATRFGDYFREYRIEVIGAEDAGNAGPGQVPISQALRLNEQTTLLNNTELAYNDLIDQRKLSVVVGLEFAWDTYDFKSKNDNPDAPPVDIFNPQQPNSNPGVPTNYDAPLATDRTTDTDSIAGYAMVAYEFIANWTVVLGVRVESFHAEVTDELTSTVVEQTDTMVDPRAGLVWDPLDELSLYASYSTSSNPTAEAYNISSAAHSLDPEENVQYEIGAKADLLNEQLMLAAAVFRLEKTNARTADPNNTAVDILDGLQRVDGFELGAAGRVTKALSIYAGYAYLNGEVVKSTEGLEGKATPNTPEHSGSVWVRYDLPLGLDIGFGMYGVDARYTNNANSTELPGYVRFDAGAGWTGEHLYVRLNAFNLFDTVYYDAGSTNFVNPGAPLSAQLTVGATF